MARYLPHELRTQLSGRLLSFPVTHATPDHRFDGGAYREHLELLSEYSPGAMTAPGGTGEFFSLTPAEVRSVLCAAVETKPTSSAILGAAGYGTATAVEMARETEAAGADGLFLLPTYLVELDQRALVDHVVAVCSSTRLGVLLYHRGGSQFTVPSVLELVDRCPNLIGFKDGVGDIELMSQLAALVGDRLALVNGLPTAEVHALAYLSAGAHSYSSAIFNFMPDWATRFDQAVRGGDVEQVHSAIRRFVRPFIAVRDRRPGYSVSIVKAAMTLVGRGAGPVRPPLPELAPEDLHDLAALLADESADHRANG